MSMISTEERLRPTPGGQTTPPFAAPEKTALLDLDGLAKTFGEHVAVHPVALEIRSGEFITLLGPSGCGKTTLLRMIAGLEQPTEGRIRVRGRDVTRLRPEHRPFNMVFQSYALFPHLNVFENVAYGLRAAGVDEKRIAERVRAALAMVRLEAHAGRPVDQLSGGMSQRVALVRAIVNEPQVLLLDEPLAALDLQLRKRMQMELRAIQERIGTTFIHVTHDQEEALVMSDRIVLMHAGRIIQIGTPREVYDHPRTRFVAEFIGDTTLVECTVEHESTNGVAVSFANGKRGEFPHYGDPGLEPRERGFISLRPQHLAVASQTQGLFEGTVTNIVFTGATTDYVVALATGGHVRVRARDAQGPQRGESVGIDIVRGTGVFVRSEAAAIDAAA